MHVVPFILIVSFVLRGRWTSLYCVCVISQYLCVEKWIGLVDMCVHLHFLDVFSFYALILWHITRSCHQGIVIFLTIFFFTFWGCFVCFAVVYKIICHIHITKCRLFILPKERFWDAWWNYSWPTKVWLKSPMRLWENKRAREDSDSVCVCEEKVTAGEAESRVLAWGWESKITCIVSAKQ